MATFEIGERDFLLDGQPYQIISGALHYFRGSSDLSVVDGGGGVRRAGA